MSTKPFTVAGVALLRQQIPEDEINQARAIGDLIDLTEWGIGRLVNHWIAFVKKHRLPVGEMDVYDFMSELISDRRRPRTIRYYASVAEFYTEETQVQYASLPFCHFALAKQQPDKWEYYLDLCLKYADGHGGKIPTRRWLEMKMTGQLERDRNDEITQRLPTDDEAFFLATGDVMDFDEIANPEMLRPESILSFRSAVNKFAALINRLPISNDAKQRLKTSVDELIASIQEAISEIQ